jgi:hypothetical protein
MAEPKVSAFVVHELPGRLRLKIPEKRGDTAYFARLAEQLPHCPGILRVDGRVHTGSLLVLHGAATRAADIDAYAGRLGLFSLTDRPATPRRTLRQCANAGVDALDRGLLAASGGVIDFGSAMLLMMLVLAARQAARGQVLVPAFSLLWFALEVTAWRKSGDK